jgi:hypothetical protein
MRKSPLKTRTPAERKERAAAKALRKPKPQKVKAPSVAVLDSLFSQYIRRNGECQLWGYGGVQCSTQLHCSHIKSRKYTCLRWDARNAIAACAAHHRAQHDHPDQNRLWLVELLGEDHLDDLQCAYLNGKKPTPAERIEIAKWLREKLREADPFA